MSEDRVPTGVLLQIVRDALGEDRLAQSALLGIEARLSGLEDALSEALRVLRDLTPSFAGAETEKP